MQLFGFVFRAVATAADASADTAQPQETTSVPDNTPESKPELFSEEWFKSFIGPVGMVKKLNNGMKEVTVFIQPFLGTCIALALLYLFLYVVFSILAFLFSIPVIGPLLWVCVLYLVVKKLFFTSTSRTYASS